MAPFSPLFSALELIPFSPFQLFGLGSALFVSGKNYAFNSIPGRWQVSAIFPLLFNRNLFIDVYMYAVRSILYNIHDARTIDHR